MYIYLMPSFICITCLCKQKHSNLIVGHSARLLRDKDGSLFYDRWNNTVYNMVLTRFAFLHVRYHDVYQRVPNSVLDFVTRNVNCEDIAMNFVVSLLCNCTGGLYVQATESRDNDALQGPRHLNETSLSSRPDHFLSRTNCSRLFARELGLLAIAIKSL